MLPKLDHAAITEFPSGAMENFGFITYREVGLLLYTNYTEAQIYSNKKYIARLLAHEFSPQWWTYLFLNEGFATFFQYYVTNHLFPELGFDEDYRTAAIQASLVNDVITNPACVPMEYYVEEQTAIRGRFNYVSYQKAGSIIGMFLKQLERNFPKRSYKILTENYYQAASPAELYKAIQEAYDEENPNGKLDIPKLMSSWSTQAGYPIVSIEKSGSKLKLSQTRYPSGNGEIYSVPLTFSTASKIDFATKTAGHWLTTKAKKLISKISISMKAIG
ncbi:hypothetical protein PVAND_009470 [Polypedilum vanderplanki]|uniref:Peptidase M1 membrane alanine aminopeptidase domain-containing protein n=1 Tax=Polypedilum vanderplanki TaxID=319348 RepID=A0A9J6CE70_POLVA|nr:hypothetical protein PVAND_009470 [Polypedilum vanderplanki]